MASLVSSKHQIVIPKKIREALDIRPGQRWEFVSLASGLHLVRVMTFDEAYGSLRGTVNDFQREGEWADDDRRRLPGCEPCRFDEAGDGGGVDG